MYKYKNKLTVKKGMKRYVARRSRIIRNNIDVDGVMVKCECYDQITINSGATAPVFFLSNSTFVNLTAMLLLGLMGLLLFRLLRRMILLVYWQNSS